MYNDGQAVIKRDGWYLYTVQYYNTKVILYLNESSKINFIPERGLVEGSFCSFNASSFG
jgi:hypothetical protein